MLDLDNVWLDKNSMQFNLNNDFPQVSIKVDNQETFINPPSQSTPMQIATVSFGKTSSTFLCTWSQVSYEESNFRTNGGYDSQLENLLDIKWYRSDQIHVNNQQFIFKQGYIAGDIDEPITVRYDTAIAPVIGFQYGDIISADQILTGNVNDDLILNQHWWNYIKALLNKGIFEAQTFDKIHEHILGVFEKNAIDTKG